MGNDTNTPALSKPVRIILISLLLLNAAGLAFAALSHRPLLHDGAYWYFFIIHDHAPNINQPFTRYFNVLFQAPAIALARYFPGDPGVRFATAWLDFIYSLHPVLSVAVTWWILRRQKLEALVIFPLLSFALATQSTIAFGVGVVPDSLSLFWPMLALLLDSKPGARANSIALTALALGLALTHEIAILMFGLLAVVALARALQASERAERRRATYLALAFAAGTIWYAWRIIGPTAANRWSFNNSVDQPLNGYQLYGMFVIAALGAYLAHAALRLPGQRLVRLLPLASTAAGAWLLASRAASGTALHLHTQNVNQAVVSRITAIPYAVALGFMAWLLVVLARRLPELRQRTHAMLCAVTAAALVISAAYDLGLTLSWREGTSAVLQALPAVGGCRSWTRAEIQPHSRKSGIVSWTLPHLSILLQGRAQVERVLLSDSEHDQNERPDGNHCLVTPDNTLLAGPPHAALKLDWREHFDFATLRLSK